MTRLLLTVLVILLFLLCVAGMWWGWRNRARRQAAILPPLPEMPGWWDRGERPGGPVLPEATGVYVGTTMAGQWQNRVAVGDIGFRSAATLELFAGGLLIDRTGATPLWIPANAVADARTDRALAGKVMGIDGLLVVRWRLGDHELDSGFRGDDKDSYGEWVRALRELAKGGEQT